MTKNNRKLIAIVGPTASGKTAIGVKLAKELNGEIVSADSRQVYRGLDLGTGKEGVPNQEWMAKITDGEKIPPLNLPLDKGEKVGVEYLRSCLRYIDNIPQWMIDICEPEEEFTLFKYLDLARAAIEDIYSRGKLPIIVGGTGLYVQGLIEGFQLKKQETRNKKQTNFKFQISNSKQKDVIPDLIRDPENYYIDSGSQITVRNDKRSREQLNGLSTEELQEILREIDQEAYKQIDQKNPHRLIRAIERAQEGIKTIKIKPDWEVLQIGITQPREILYERIDKRVDDRFAHGMLEEAENLIKSGVDLIWLFNLGLEYKVMTSFEISDNKFQISNKIQNYKIKELIKNSKLEIKNYDDMVQTLKLRSHQYAKRQLTWFGRFSEIIWESDFEKIKNLTKEYLK